MIDYQKNWNDRFGGGEYIFGKEPNKYLQTKLDEIKPGKIFLPGDGEGRNAVYAALNGWNVTSADFSEVALDRAKEFASDSNADINFKFVDLIEDELPTGEYDVVGISFLHFNGKTKKIVHQKLNDTLQVGGILILECFSTEQIKLNSGGPRKKDSLYTIEELKSYYQGFEFIEAEDIKIQLDEGQGHQGDAYVVRIFARKLK
jgi:SAM-dependent methyltransferase